MKSLHKKFRVLIIGSGAAGLAAALRLDRLGVQQVALFSEGLSMGTSINTGSDKQTYYKLGMYGATPDSVLEMAQDLAAGGSMHGDLALTEAALSAIGFANLVNIGVPFPHDAFGEFIGYKTDHDPKRRASSTGPYTSRDMCRCLIREIKKSDIEIFEKRIAVKLLVENNRCFGAIFINRTECDELTMEVVYADEIILAAGGPGGLYENSVYPKVHTGGIGLALQEGALGRNLTESQFGLASTKFRWNVSGSYMQVLPRFVSTDANGNNEKEFLRDYFTTQAEMYDAVFLKGYQWPFAAAHVPGSSLIDIFVYLENVVHKRKVFLDYRRDSTDFSFDLLGGETKEYLQKSNAVATSPLLRLKQLNAPAIELYRKNGIDLSKEMLEIAVCAQHNNGGLACDVFGASENIKNLYAVGEINGSHGVTRPGGSALNAGQCTAFMAAQKIAAACRKRQPLTAPKKENISCSFLADLEKRLKKDADDTSIWRVDRQEFQHRMSSAGAFLRDETQVRPACVENQKQLVKLRLRPLGGMSAGEVTETIRNEQLVFSSWVYLSSMMHALESGVGSRGGALVLSDEGEKFHPLLDMKHLPEKIFFRQKVLMTQAKDDTLVQSFFIDCRPIPICDGWFENIWKEYRTDAIYGENEDEKE